MKRFLSIIFIFLLGFSFIACDKEDDLPDDGGNGENQQAEELTNAKTSAVTELENYVAALNQSDYVTSDWSTIQNKLAQAKASIEAATDQTAIATIISDAKTYIDSVAKIDLLGDAKIAATSTISAFSDQEFFEEFYSEEIWEQIEGIIDAALTAVEQATTVDAVNKVVTDARTEIAALPTLEQQLQLVRDEATASLDAEYAKYNASDYTAEDYTTITNIYQTTQFSILIGKTETEIEAAVALAIEQMAAVQKLLFITYENIEDSFWLYSSTLEMREELLADFNAAKKQFTDLSSVAKNFPDDFTFETFPTGGFDVVDMVLYFYYSEVEGVKMSEKWDFLFQFLMENSPSSTNKAALKLMFACATAEELLASSAYNVVSTPYAISYDFSAFLIAGIYRKGNGTYQTADYSNKAELEKVYNFLSAAESYLPGTVYEIPSPAKKYQEFLGWYDNPEFTGEPITVLENLTSSITLYAKWSELSSEGQLGIYKDSKIKELEAYLESSKDATQYSAAAWLEVEAALEVGIADIQAQTTTETVDTALANAKAALDAVLPTVYTVKYELNGGHWSYANKEELVNGFLADFSKFKGTTVTVTNFFDQSFGGAYLFFTEYTQWAWLPEYLESLQPTLEGKMIIDENGMAQVRIEIKGYLGSNIAQNSDGSYISCDYSAYAEDLGFVEYLKQSEYQYVEEQTLLTPIKDGYKFIGWYTNVEFTGDAVTIVNANATLYAKFEELTDTDVLNAAITQAKSDLESYIEENKDLTKFNEADLAAFNARVAELITAIEEAETLELVANALEAAKAEVDAYEDSTYVVEFVLDGGNWYYANKAEMVAGFMADIKKYLPNATLGNFFSSTYSGSGKINTFFEECTQWQWLLTYLATTCDPSKAAQFKINASTNLPEVRAELHGFLNDKVASESGYTSSDYSGEADDYVFVEYFQQTTLEFVDNPAIIPVVVKYNYTFVGWYDNPEFTGEAVTEVTGPTKLYAKWEISE